MKNKLIHKTLLITSLMLGVTTLTQATLITLNVLPATGTDGASGISASNDYTHTFNFGVASGGSVNGVSFTGAIGSIVSSNPVLLMDANTSNALTLVRSGGNSLRPFSVDGLLGSGTLLADGDSFNLLNPFSNFNAAQAGSTLTFTMGGLTSGTDYIARLYGVAWNTAPDGRNIEVTMDSETLTVDWSDLDDNGVIDVGQAFYVEMQYTATSSEHSFALGVQTASNGPHMSGFTNQLAAVPEPSAYAFALGSLIAGWICIRRRIFSGE